MSNPARTEAPATLLAAGGARLAGLDGLRAIAVLLVMLCHGKLVASGWVGVQLFFVLSGFLITRILLEDRRSAPTLGGYFGRFYARRALRIFPLYYAYLGLLGIAVLSSPAMGGLAERLLPAAVYGTNFWALQGVAEASRYTDHLWSLAVEEQFYLVWPLLLALVPAARLPALLVAIIVAGPLLRALAWYGGPLLGEGFALFDTCTGCAVYTLPTSHLDAFAWGAALNVVRWRPRTWHFGLALAITLALGIAANGWSRSLQLGGQPMLMLGWPLFLQSGLQSIWGYTLLNLVAVLLIGLVLRGGRAQRLFSHPALEYLGQRSYGMYVLHFPLLQLLLPVQAPLRASLGETWGTVLFQPLLIAATLAAAAISYRWLERPLLDLRHRWRSPRPALSLPSAQPA